MDLVQFIQTFVPLERLQNSKCNNCSTPASYISLGVQSIEGPTFDFWCVQCYLDHDFYDMVTSQVLPTNHDFYDIVTNAAINDKDVSQLKYKVKYESDNKRDSWTEYCPEIKAKDNVLGLGSDCPQVFYVDKLFFLIIPYGKEGLMSNPGYTKLNVYYMHLEKAKMTPSGKTVYVHIGYLNGDSLEWKKGWDSDDDDELKAEDYVWELTNFSYTTHRGHTISYTGKFKIISVTNKTY